MDITSTTETTQTAPRDTLPCDAALSNAEICTGDPQFVEDYCPFFQHTIELIGRRWTGVVLLALSRGPKRFSRLRGVIPGLSDRLLSERLTELEASGFVDRIEADDTITYQLSDVGQGLIAVLDAVEVFARATAPKMNCGDRPGRRC
jgi:DNA-binding HxlR family transcriptional regulator